MKFNLIFVSALFVASQSSTMALAVLDGESAVGLEARGGPPASCGNPRATLPLLRAWNPRVSDHFYTTSADEMQNAIIRFGYTDEGTTGHVFTTQEPSTVPLYRLYHPNVNDHFYTASASERDSAIRGGYQSEGIAGYIYPNTACGGRPLYRLYHGRVADHFYTMSEAEKNSAQNGGYTYEGVTGYIFPF